MPQSKKLRVLILPSILCMFAMLLAACGGGSGAPTTATSSSKPVAASADKQILRYPIGNTDFGTMDPALVQDATDSYTMQTIMTGLVQFKDDGTVVDQLAASHKVSSDGLTYTFTLKPSLKFSDGSPLTSKDIAYGINRALDPATKSPVAYYLALLKDYDAFQGGKVKTLIGDSIVTPDDNTIALTISKPAAYFLQALTYPISYPVEKSLIDKYADKWTDHLNEGGCSGPFKVQSYSHTTGMDVVPNSNYYGAKPQLQKISFLISGDTATTLKAYLSGQYDRSLAIPSASLASMKTRPDYHNSPALVIRYLSMNFLSKPFNNLHIRQAFALAINKDLLVQTVLRGAVIPTNHIVPKGMPGYTADLKGPDGTTSTAGNAAQAKQLLQQGLQEAGYSSASALPPVTFTYYTGNPTIQQLSSALAQEWQTVLGVTVKLQAVDFDKETTLLNSTTGHDGPLQIWISGWQADYPDPQDWLSIFFTKGAGYNNSNYGQNNSPEAAAEQTVQNSLLQADVNQDNTSRMAAYSDAEQKIVNDVGWIPLYQSEVHILQNPKLQGLVDNPLGIAYPEDWGSIYFAQ